jgi:2-polyprenyl-3-methyl-5-hydroxy-6-metoxy-1,4-benzoquinol methylase
MREQPYHKYVFDTKNRKFVGQFEKMYADEDKYNFDSWFQDSMDHLGKEISLLLIHRYNFNSILDIGCGKGAFTSLLKKKNNIVMGIDISDTAIKKSKARYNQVEFRQATVDQALAGKETWDLIVIIEVLSYIKHWKDVLASAAGKTKYLYLSIYLPDNPIGYVKNFDDFRKEIKKHFTIEDELFWNNSTILLMVQSKKVHK